MSLTWIAFLLWTGAYHSASAGGAWGGCPGSGLFPDPLDCTVYYSCANGVDTAMHCPSGLYFNPKTQTCDWPRNVDCAATAPCTPSCAAKQCGSNGCGGSCGNCTAGKTCDPTGQCVSSCVPSCRGKTCGTDGCGGSCGTCSSGLTCNSTGLCTCVPSCAGRACGSDGCGGSCGTCPSGKACDTTGICVTALTFTCSGKPNGYYGDPSNCALFHICSNGIDTVQSCPTGLLWNAPITACDWPANVKCG